MQSEIIGDYNFCRRFLPELKAIAGRHLIGEAPQEEDRERATDLIVLRLEAVRIACRVRRPQYAAKYGDQFTIRRSRPSGARTELRKFLEGWAHFLLYGIAADNDRLGRWFIGDLRVFRGWHAEQMHLNKGALPGISCDNGDGTRFQAYPLAKMPEAFVVADSEQGPAG